MELISHGAAREVTGSCHELKISDKRILLDCGLFQGSRKKSVEKNAAFNFDPAKDIDAVIISHSHMDHVGRVPVLYKRGYRGPVFCTYATKDLAEVMLQDSGYIQEKDEEYFCKHLPDSMMPCEGPLYTQEDAKKCMEIFTGMNYGDWFEVVPPSTSSGQGGVRAKFLDAGHVLGAAMVIMESDDALVGFTGDLGRDMLPIIRDPEQMPPVDVLLSESTYGNRKHEGIETAKDHLKDVITRTAERGGKVLIPAFSLERTQEIIYDLHILWDEKQIPEIPIVIDSPLASRVTQVFMKHPECYDTEMYENFLAKKKNPFQFKLVRYTESVEESKALNSIPGPMVIMAGSGMCEGGRIRHHLRRRLEDSKNTVLIVGYMAENTLGRRLIEKSVRAVKIFDQMYEKRAEVVGIDAYSGHADCDDLDEFIGNTEVKNKIYLVHGEQSNMEAFAGRIRQNDQQVEVVMPERGMMYNTADEN